jgi:hypothetical protein
MATALTALGTTTLSSTATSVTLTFPSGYRDLQLIINGTTTSSTVDAIILQFNGDMGSNYSVVYATGDGTNATSSTQATTYLSAGVMGTSQSVTIIDIMDYSQTDKHKSVIARGNTPGWGTRMIAGRWASTAAITSIVIKTEAGLTFSIGDSFSLYGIAG